MKRGLPRMKPTKSCRHPEIDYKDLEYLRKHISAQGQIVSRRKTALCSRCQRNLKRAIKRARYLALVPHVG
jgi:small subunit ribosomal protein S18